jgi:hypothetical protein
MPRLRCNARTPTRNVPRRKGAAWAGLARHRAGKIYLNDTLLENRHAMRKGELDFGDW